MGLSQDWKTVPLGKVATLQRGFDLPKRLRKPGPYPIVTSSGIEEHHGEARVKGPGVVTGRYGTIGKVFFISENFWPLNTTLYVRDFHGNDPRFVSYLLRRINFEEHSGKTGVPGINRNDLHEVSVSLPSTKREQEAIAEALSDADALIESLEQLLTKKRHLKQGAMQELLTGKKRLPGFREPWHTKRLGDLGVFLKGRGVTKDQASSGNVPCVRYGELYTRHNDVVRIFYSWISPEVAATATQLRSGDILFAGSGETKEEIGKCAAFVSECEAYAGGDIVILRTYKEDPRFLGYYLNTEPIVRQKASLGQGDAVVHIGAVSLASIEGSFPQVREQTAIAAALIDLDEEIGALEAKLSKARLLKQGMMQELLTGRIRLVRSTTLSVLPSADRRKADDTNRPHNPQIDGAVVIAVLANRFGTEQYPLARVRRTKLSYLLFRHMKQQTDGFMKKAAGPYNPKTRYGGPEGIALKNLYVRVHHNGQYEGFVAAENIAQAEGYFEKWYGLHSLEWLEQFRRKSTEELELLSTVDMASEELRHEGKSVNVSTVKEVLRADKEWKAKLDRSTFSDAKIAGAIQACHQLFSTGDGGR